MTGRAPPGHEAMGGVEVARPAPAGPLRTRQAAEKLDRGYLGRVLQLTLLAADIVEAVLDGRQPEGRRCRP